MTTFDRQEPTLDLDATDEMRPRPGVPHLDASWPSSEQPVLYAQTIIDRTGLAHLIVLLRIKMGFPAEVFDLAARPLINGYAEFVQLLPVAGSRRYGEPGGQLHRALATALRALDHRRGQILPRGAPPEIIGAQAHRWTYAVFAAALLRDAARVCAGLKVWAASGTVLPEVWDPTVGSLFVCGAQRYSVELASPGELAGGFDGKTAVQVFERCVPPIILSWLQEDAGLMAELLAVLGGRADPASAIAELVRLAATGPGKTHIPVAEPEPMPSPNDPAVEPNDRPVPVLPAAPTTVEPEFLEDVNADADGVALAQQFMAWLRQGVLNGTLPVNRPDALVHVVNEGLLLSSPRIFREFARERAGAEPAGDAAKRVQRDVLRAGWHLRADGGVNMLCYERTRAGRSPTRITGIVIRDPRRFIDPLPAVDTTLARAIDRAAAVD
jgi:hypothetical protein